VKLVSALDDSPSTIFQSVICRFAVPGHAFTSTDSQLDTRFGRIVLRASANAASSRIIATVNMPFTPP